MKLSHYGQKMKERKFQPKKKKKKKMRSGQPAVVKNMQIDIYTFSFISGTVVEKSCFLCRLKILYKQLLIFLSFMKTFFKSN